MEILEKLIELLFSGKMEELKIPVSLLGYSLLPSLLLIFLFIAATTFGENKKYIRKGLIYSIIIFKYIITFFYGSAMILLIINTFIFEKEPKVGKTIMYGVFLINLLLIQLHFFFYKEKNIKKWLKKNKRSIAFILLMFLFLFVGLTLDPTPRPAPKLVSSIDLGAIFTQVLEFKRGILASLILILSVCTIFHKKTKSIFFTSVKPFYFYESLVDKVKVDLYLVYLLYVFTLSLNLFDGREVLLTIKSLIVVSFLVAVIQKKLKKSKKVLTNEEFISGYLVQYSKQEKKLTEQGSTILSNWIKYDEKHGTDGQLLYKIRNILIDNTDFALKYLDDLNVLGYEKLITYMATLRINDNTHKCILEKIFFEFCEDNKED